MTIEIEEKLGNYQDEKIGNKGKRDRELYILWASIPTYLKRAKMEDLEAIGYPIDDPIFRRLIQCKSQNQFCTEFNIGKNQPKYWRDHMPEITKQIEDLAQKSNVLRFEKDVDFAFTQRTIRNADAPRVKLWKQIFKGWTEKSGVELSGKVTTIQELVMQLEEEAELEKNA